MDSGIQVLYIEEIGPLGAEENYKQTYFLALLPKEQ